MDIERTAYKNLLEWKSKRPNLAKAFMLKGPRQSGKTWLIRKFGKDNYKSVVEINFHTDPASRDIFSGSLSPDDIIMNISAQQLDAEFIPGNTLLFLDEIQECDRAYAALKPLAQDKRFDTIASGSLLGLGYKVSSASYPVGYVQERILRPLSFLEFIKAMGIQQNVVDHLRQCMESKKEVNRPIHERLLSLWRTYVVVGGMPDAVRTFIETRTLGPVVEIQKTLHHDYELDVMKYANKNDVAKIKAIYDKIPITLASGSRRFMLSEIDKNARYERYESGFAWLFDSGTVLPCLNVTEPVIPFEVNRERTLQKLFLSDVGMLCAQTLGGSQFELLSGQGNINPGYIWESAIAQELTAAGHEKLFYFDKKSVGEVDFLVCDGSGTVPIEVKSGKDWKRHKALDRLLETRAWQIGKAYVLSQGNVESDGPVTNLPWYMSMFLAPADLDTAVDFPDLSQLGDQLKDK